MVIQPYQRVEFTTIILTLEDTRPQPTVLNYEVYFDREKVKANLRTTNYWTGDLNLVDNETLDSAIVEATHIVDGHAPSFAAFTEVSQFSDQMQKDITGGISRIAGALLRNNPNINMQKAPIPIDDGFIRSMGDISAGSISLDVREEILGIVRLVSESGLLDLTAFRMLRRYLPRYAEGSVAIS